MRLKVNPRLAADDVLDALVACGSISEGPMREIAGLALELFAAGIARKYGATNTATQLGLGLGERVARLVLTERKEIRPWKKEVPR